MSQRWGFVRNNVLWHPETPRFWSYFYSILSHNLGRSSGHHRWIRNNPFPSWPVFSCPSWAGKVHSCPLFDIVFPPTSSSVCLFFFFLSLCPVGLSLLNQKTLRHGQTILAFVFDQGQEFVIFSNGCLDLSANLLFDNMVLIWNVQ